MRKKTSRRVMKGRAETLARVFILEPPVVQVTTEKGTYHITGIPDDMPGIFLAAVVVEELPTGELGWRVSCAVPKPSIEDATPEMLHERNITKRKMLMKMLIQENVDCIQDFLKAGAEMRVEFQLHKKSAIWGFNVLSSWRVEHDPDDESGSVRFQLSFTDDYVGAVAGGGLLFPGVKIDVADWIKQLRRLSR